ncbi:MAG TPA: hypothetical protein VFU62_00045 [Hanamia sp.]|nr:hypothetical protein [Hanamia sp.]
MNMLLLSKKWVPRLLSQGETGMDYQIASILLKDGKKFDQAVIIDGCIAKIRYIDVIPFKEEDIKDIVVTHDKWDWSKEEW